MTCHCNGPGSTLGSLNRTLVLTGALDVEVGAVLELVPDNTVPDARGGTLIVADTINVDGHISADAVTEGGPGQGDFDYNNGPGAGHAAPGGSSPSTAGGAVYGLPAIPDTFGSQGGSSNNHVGGLGGGAVHLAATSITIAGMVSASGGLAFKKDFEAELPGDGSRPGGGGSAGSVWITAQTLTGNGNVTAVGGSAFPGADGGSGSGGYVQIEADSMDNLVADAAGGSAEPGRAGGDGVVVTNLGGVTLGCLALYNCSSHGTCVGGLCECDTAPAAWNGFLCDFYNEPVSG